MTLVVVVAVVVAAAAAAAAAVTDADTERLVRYETGWHLQFINRPKYCLNCLKSKQGLSFYGQ